MRGVGHTQQYLKDLQAGKHQEVSEKFKDGVIATLQWALDRKVSHPILTTAMLEKTKAPKKDKVLTAKNEKKEKKAPAQKKAKADKKAASSGFYPVPKPSQAV